MNEKNIKLEVIPKPAEGSQAIITNVKPPIIKGNGNVNYVCGKCGTILIENHTGGAHIINIVLLCSKCGSYNKVNI